MSGLTMAVPTAGTTAWRALLDATPPAPAPADRAHQAGQPTGSATVAFTVPAGLQSAAPDRRTAVLLVVVHTLLARHSGRWDGIVGLADGGRTLPLPLHLGPRLPVQGALGLATQVIAAARTAPVDDDVPVDVLVEDLHEPTTPPSGLELPLRPGLVVRLRRGADGTVAGELRYATARLSGQTADRVAARLGTLCAAAVGDTGASTALGRLDVLPRAERQAVLPPATPVQVPETSVAGLVAARATATPAAVAVACGDERLSYAELLDRADAVAARLHAVGVGRGDRVGVLVPRSTDLPATLLGVLRTGAAYVPLDPEHPAERLAYVLADAAVRAVVVSGVHSPHHGSTGATLDAGPRPGVAVVDLADVPRRCAPAWRPATVHPDDPAYVIYTSGSTGHPKGVVVAHRALANLLHSMALRPGITPGTAFPAVTTVSFDIAALELYLPLLVGARVELSGPGEAQDPERLAGLLARTAAPAMQATPVTWQLLLDGGWQPPAGFTALCGGERLPATLAHRLGDAGVRLFDLYGPTETTVWSSVAEVAHGVVGEFAAVANTTLYVLDERLEPMPLGAVGELHIGGDGVAVGYLDRPALTADRFVPDHRSAAPGARLYRTGDLARRHPDGRVEILGRTDHQIKVRGFRVEPGEIEHVLALHAGVHSAVVQPMPDGDGIPQLVAYLGRAGRAAPPTPGELQHHCLKRLPSHMVPARFVVLDSLPTTPNGKVDRAALPAPTAASAVPAAGPRARTAVEASVAAILSEVLDHPGLGLHDDFFALGGHSLAATRAVIRLRAEFGVHLPVSALFQARTVAGLAAGLAAADTAGRPAPRGIGDGPVPLSWAQRQMWFLHQLDPAGTAYLEAVAVPLPGPFHPAAAERAVTDLVARHEILRTRYPVGDAGEPVQMVEPAAPVRLTVCTGDPDELLGTELSRPFDLSAAPPVRIRLVRATDGTHTVLLVLHHIATDDATNDILAADLVAAYRGDPLPRPAMRYAEYAGWQRDLLAAGSYRNGLRYWKGRLTGLEPTELWTDHPRQAVPDGRGATVRFTVPAAVTTRLAELGARLRATPFNALSAAFLALTARYVGRDDVAVGVPVYGRDLPELENVAGLFVNTVVLRADVSAGRGFTDLLAAVRDSAVAAYAHADVPFELVVEELAPQRDLSRNPLFGLYLALHTAPAGRTVPAPTGAKFDAGVHLTERPDGGLDGRIEYAAGLFDEDTIAGFAASYVDLLRAVADAPTTPIRDLARPAVPAAPQLAGPPATGTVADLVSAHACRDTVAVVGNGRTLTWRQLEREVNQMAHRLRELGAGPGGFVAVRLPRTADVVVALLAVLRCGAAYIPLDPGHPGQRLRQALADSGADIVIRAAGSLDDLPAGVRSVAPADPGERARLRRLPETPPAVSPAPDDLAYVVYTSGSTGRPKGAMVTHRGLTGYTRWAVTELPLAGSAGSPLHTSLAYDLALTALFPALAAGSPVRLVPDEPGVGALARELSDRDTEPYGLVKLTPTHLDLLGRTLPRPTPGTTRCLVVGGEQLHGEQLTAWAEGAPDTRIVNSYGPSETAVACCAHTARAGDVGHGPVPIGRPIAGARVLLLDAGMRPVPAGAPGELHVGGPGVGRGYLRDARLTADRFVPDPYGGEPGARLYRTGDVARLRADGELVFLGRRDDQVKIHGFRVEPGEVEAVLAEHPDVRVAAVVVDRADPAGPRLAAHVAGSTVTAGDLRAYLAERLPAHLVPTLWATTGQLPLLGNGKVDRRALPAAVPAATTGRHVEAPATPAERAIAELWADVLGVTGVGRHDEFFELGGQSLLATRVAAVLGDRFGVGVSVRDVFSARTVAALAELVARRVRRQVGDLFGDAADRSDPPGEPAAPAPGPIPAAPRTGPLPLSYAQRGLWLVDQMERDATDYLVVTALRLRGSLDVAALGDALSQVAARHEILRTRYVPGPDGEPLQVVDPPARVLLTAEDGEPQAVLTAESARPIDLAVGPVMRARLVRVTVDEHVLVLVVHHIATDGWSTGVLAGELAAAYRGATLPQLAVQYADYAAWQRERLAGPAADALVEHWRQRLAGLEPTELPSDRPRPAVRDPRGAAHRFAVPPALARRLTDLGRRAGTTPATTYLTGFLTLVSRYTGHHDLAVGVPVAGRAHPGLDRLIGCFVNTVVLRADLSGGPSFTDALRRVGDAATDAYQHDELPFERLVEELAPRRDLSRNPLFQLLYAFREEGDERFELPDLEVSGEPVPQRTAKFDLTVELTRRSDGGLTGEIEYATALFDADTVARLARHYLRLLAAAADRPAEPLGRLPMLSDAERRALTRDTDGPVRARPDIGLPELVGRQAARTPDAVAVAHDGDVLTYGELDAAATRLARHLGAGGVRRDDVVGLCLPRGLDLVTALLGTLRAGAGFMPMDPAHPVERLRWMLADSGARMVVVPGAGSPVATGHAVPLLDLTADRAAIAARAAGPAPVTTDPDSLAYLIYTSGSTGRPKGVAVPHRGIQNRVLWAVERHGLAATDRLLQKTAPTFDASVWEFLGPLVSGATVVLAPDGAERDPAAMIEVLVRERITVLQAVPSFLGALADEPGLSRCTTLRLLFSAGEALPVELAGRLTARLTAATLINTYGPTEASIDVTSWTFTAEADPAGNGTVAIGLPLDNTRAVVCAPDATVVPPGVSGELRIAGAGLARGYVGDPRMTADRFLPDPYGPPGSRAYRTGDVVRRRPDGRLDFHGRADQQVKIRGVRVEPGEVETVLLGHPAVAAAAVVARPAADGTPRLVGYLVPRGAAPASSELRAFLLARLPEPYVPSVLTTLDRLPVTVSGKVDRAALPEPAVDGTTGGRPALPVTATEKLVADVMLTVLGLPEVGCTDDFFELGGHSLLAVRVASRLRAATGTDIDVRAVFADRTVTALADRITRLAGQTADRPAASPIRDRQSAVAAPLSFAQRRLWFLDLLAPGGSEYHVTWALRLSGALDVAALAGALTDLYSRHAVLRTRYVTGPDNEPVQVIDPVVPVDVPVADVSEQGLAGELATLAARPFDLARHAPVAAYLLRLGADDHVFLHVMHHIAGDARSEEILARDLSELYAARLEGRPSAPVAPGPQYADYAVWQAAQLCGQRADREVAYWRDRLAGLPPLELPTDHPRPPTRDGHGATVEFRVPAQVAEPLVALGRRHGATAFMTFLGIFAALLGRYSGSTDLPIGTVVAGRGRPELEDLVGCFVNTVVLRLDTTDDPSPAILVERVRDTALDVFGHDELPFDRLVEELVPQRDMSRLPLCDVMFGLRESVPEPVHLAGLEVMPTSVVRRTAKCDLTLTLAAEPDGGYVGELEYATALFTEETVRRLGRHLVSLARSAAAHPHERIDRLALLDAAERRRMLTDWNAAPAAVEGPGLPEALAARAALTPESVALDGAGGRLSYAALDRRVDALAHRLVAAGVRPEAPVAVYLDRSTAAVVVMLAVLRAGGVYVPLNTAQPAERLTRMLDDLRPALLVTEERLAGRMDGAARRVLLVDCPSVDPTARTGAAAPAGSDPDRLAYMIYTSGSTGRPKAVMVPHRALAHHARVIAGVYDIRPGDRVSLQQALSFDPTVEQIAAPLLVGATVVVEDAESPAPTELPARIAAGGLTHLALPPAYYRELVATLPPADPRLGRLRLLAVGGDVVTYDDDRRWHAGGQAAELLCLYGPTEATVTALTHRTTAAERAAAQPRSAVPIGRPVPGTRVYVVDRHGQPVPVGVAGELLLGGDRLSRGYLRQPRLTADRFVPDPFGTTPGARLHRTGDQVRYRGDGVVEFLGRVDDQVKLRGFRIELGEVEAALADHPALHAAAVAVRDSALGERQLVGYVVPKPGGQPPSPADLRGHLRDRVPEYMLPGAWVVLDALPLNASHKVDRRALPGPTPQTGPAGAGLPPPQGAVEEAIAGLWAEILGVREVSAEADFFHLGGHSLLATRLMGRLEDLFGMEVPLRVLFAATTVRAQASALERLAEQGLDQRPVAVAGATVTTRAEGSDDEH